MRAKFCRTIIIASDAKESPPMEIQIIPFGEDIPTEKGPFTLDEEGAKAIILDFDAQKNDMVIDYEHRTLSGQEAPAAGWIKKLFAVIPASEEKDSGQAGTTKGQAGMTEKKAPGIWAVVEWTDRAKQYLKNREYRYLSPVFLKRLSDNKVVRLINAALTNQPAIDGMEPIVNKGAETPDESGDVGARLGAPAKQGKEERIMKRLLEMLGLPETATEDEAVAVIRTMLDTAAAAQVASKEVLAALGLTEGASASEVTGTIIAMKQSYEKAPDLTKRVSELEASAKKKCADELVETAMKEGKVTPAQKDWALSYAGRDPEGFKVFVSKAAVVVPMAEVAGAARSETGVAPLDEMQMAVNKALGVSEEMFKKHAQKEA